MSMEILFTFACVHTCMIRVNVAMWVCHSVCVAVKKDNLECRSSSPTLFETGSIVLSFIYQTSQLWRFQEASWLYFLSCYRSTGISDTQLTEVLGIWTQLLTFVQQTFYTLSYLSSPQLGILFFKKMSSIKSFLDEIRHENQNHI